MKKQNMKHKLLSLLGLLVFAGLFIGFELYFNQPKDLDKSGSYTSKEAVSLYLVTYETLPDNYITKSEAMKLGWKSSEGNLWDVTDQKSIGGDVFRNREKALPIKDGRTYYEADIDYAGGYRNEKRIVYSDDGLIYYTHDHYKNFELLYGDE